MLARIGNQLRRRIETHGLTVEQGTGKRRGVVTLQPRGGIGQQRKTGGVGFGKAVFAEALYLVKDLLCEMLRIAARLHTRQQFFFELVQPALAFPGRHAAAQPVCIPCAESRCNHGQLHHLFLENGHAQGAAQHVPDRIAGIGDRFLAITAAQIGMHHVALYRTGTDDRNLDHQVVVVARFQARQHGHLRP